MKFKTGQRVTLSSELCKVYGVHPDVVVAYLSSSGKIVTCTCSVLKTGSRVNLFIPISEIAPVGGFGKWFKEHSL